MGWGRYFVESKGLGGDIIPGSNMITDLTTHLQSLRGMFTALALLLAATVCLPLRAQDVKINIGGGNAEEAKADQALAEKLPPDQAAAAVARYAGALEVAAINSPAATTISTFS